MPSRCFTQTNVSFWCTRAKTLKLNSFVESLRIVSLLRLPSLLPDPLDLTPNVSRRDGESLHLQSNPGGNDAGQSRKGKRVHMNMAT